MGRKEEFEEWLKTQKKSNREPYAEKTRKFYAYAIGKVSKWVNDTFEKDLYSIDDSNELNQIFASFVSSPAYLEEKKNNWGTTFLKFYKQFVASKFQNG